MKTKKAYNFFVNLISIVAVVSMLFSFATNIYAIGQGQDDDVDMDIYGGSETPDDPSVEEVDGGTMKIYTIEDLFFNRIPMLDANFFTETAGGKEIKKGSAIEIIRNVVKIWYISFRNVAIVVIAIVIIFAGLRMAIATVAEDKANYKKMLVNWTKALVIVLMIHIIMFAVQYFNSRMLEILQDSLTKKYDSQIDPDTGQPMSNTGQVYNTIVKRAFDVRYKIGIPGAIMYLVLTIFFIRFCFIYVRRYAGIIILTILAPLVAIKQAILSLNGKNSNEFGRWLGDYITTTFLQSIHALVFLTLITSAIDLALTNIAGFVVALLMLHAVTQITVLATQIFNFNSNGGGRGSLISQLLTPGEETAPLLTASTYLSVKTWQNIGKSFKGIKTSTVHTVDKIKESELTKKVKEVTGVTAMQARREATIRANSANDLESTYNDDGTVNQEQTRRILKSSVKRKNSQGKASKLIITGLKDYKGKKMFTGGIKQALAITGGLMSIPLMVASDSRYETGHQNLGMLLGVASTDLFIKGGNEVMAGAKQSSAKKKEKYNKVMNNVVVGNRLMDTLDEEFERMPRQESYDGRNALRAVNKYNVNSFSLKNALRTSISMHNIRELNASNVDLVVDDIMKTSKINIRVEDPTKRARYKAIIRDTLLENADAINGSIRSGSIYDDEIGDSDVMDNAREMARNGEVGYGYTSGSDSGDGIIGPDGSDGHTEPEGPIGPDGGPDGPLRPGESGSSSSGDTSGSGTGGHFASGSAMDKEKLEKEEKEAKAIEAQIDHIDIERRRVEGRKKELEKKMALLGSDGEKDQKELKKLTEELGKLDADKRNLTSSLDKLKHKYNTKKTSSELNAGSGDKKKGLGFSGNDTATGVAERNEKPGVSSEQRPISPKLTDGAIGPKGTRSQTVGGSINKAKEERSALERKLESAKRSKQSSGQEVDSVIQDTERKLDELETRLAEVERLSKISDPKLVSQSDIDRQLTAIRDLENQINASLNSASKAVENSSRPSSNASSTSETRSSSSSSTSRFTTDGPGAIPPEGTRGTTDATSRTTTPTTPGAGTSTGRTRTTSRTRSADGGFVDLAQALSDRLTGQIVEDTSGNRRFAKQANKFNTIRDINQVSAKQGVAPYSLDSFILELK